MREELQERRGDPGSPTDASACEHSALERESRPRGAWGTAGEVPVCTKNGGPFLVFPPPPAGAPRVCRLQWDPLFSFSNENELSGPFPPERKHRQEKWRQETHPQPTLRNSHRLQLGFWNFPDSVLHLRACMLCRRESHGVCCCVTVFSGTCFSVEVHLVFND